MVLYFSISVVRFRIGSFFGSLSGRAVSKWLLIYLIGSLTSFALSVVPYLDGSISKWLFPYCNGDLLPQWFSCTYIEILSVAPELYGSSSNFFLNISMALYLGGFLFQWFSPWVLTE